MAVRAIEESAWCGVLRVQAESYATSLLESVGVLRSKWHTSPDTCFIYVDEKSEVLGYLLAYPWPGSVAPKLHEETSYRDASDNLYLHDLAVSTGARGKGIAQTLVHALLQSARDLGYKTISLVALQGADKFWRKHGFVPAADIPLHHSYGEDAQFMRLCMPSRSS